MAKIKIIFTRPLKKLDPFAWGVRLMTWAPYCHVAIRVDDRIFHAVQDGCVWVDAPSFDAKNETVAAFEISLSDFDSAHLIQSCKKLTGRKYDWNAVAGLALARIAHYLGHPLKDNPLKNNSMTLFCSELAYHVLRSLKLIPRDSAPELLDPKRLLRLLEKQKHPQIKRLF